MTNLNKFSGRMEAANIAVTKVVEAFAKHNITIIIDGHEINPNLKIHSINHNDPTMRFIRHRSDTIGIDHKTSRNFLCEVKAAHGEHSQYLIEAEAFYYLRKYILANPDILAIVVWAHTDCDNDKIQCIWVDSIREPYKVYIPDRFDSEEKTDIIKKLYPKSMIESVQNRTGSGTPYFKFPREKTIPIDIFVREAIRMTQTKLPLDYDPDEKPNAKTNDKKFDAAQMKLNV